MFYYIPATSNKKLTIPDTILIIHPYSFTSSKIEEITINHYIDIMDYAFTGCKYLNTVTMNFDRQHKKLDNGIFENCDALTTINLCNYFSKFGNNCFRKCNSLESIVIPEGTESIGIYCFAECDSLKKITFPSNEIYISRGCFYKCKGFSSLNFSTSTIHYDSYVYDSTSVTSVTILDSISEGMFNNCDKLENVKFIDEYITSIPDYCFNSSGITQIRLPASVSSLGSYCFAYTKLKRFIITKYITSIHPQAFYGVEDLKLELGCDHPKYLLGSHELIEKETQKLVLTYGKLLSSYIVPTYVREIGNNAINSYPKYNYTSGKGIDFGVTTLVIRTKIIINYNPLFNAPYLHNLCYGGNVKVDGFMDVPRIFVSDNYIRSIWNQRPRKEVIFGECDFAVPFENYAKFDYSYPTNPRYIDLPNETVPQGSEECPIIDDTNDLPDFEPDISPKGEEISPNVQQMSSSSSQIMSENSVITESESSAEFIGSELAGPSQTKSKLMMYILIAVSAAEVLLIAWLIVFIISKKNEEISDKSFQEVSEHVITEVPSELTFTNPLFAMSTTMEDDPFANDFEEGKGSYEGYFNDNCLVDE